MNSDAMWHVPHTHGFFCMNKQPCYNLTILIFFNMNKSPPQSLRDDKTHIFHKFIKNGLVSHGQKGVDGRSKWRAGMRETEVRLDGWCEG